MDGSGPAQLSPPSPLIAVDIPVVADARWAAPREGRGGGETAVFAAASKDVDGLETADGRPNSAEENLAPQASPTNRKRPLHLTGLSGLDADSASAQAVHSPQMRAVGAVSPSVSFGVPTPSRRPSHFLREFGLEQPAVESSPDGRERVNSPPRTQSTFSRTSSLGSMRERRRTPGNPALSQQASAEATKLSFTRGAITSSVRTRLIAILGEQRTSEIDCLLQEPDMQAQISSFAQKGGQPQLVFFYQRRDTAEPVLFSPDLEHDSLDGRCLYLIRTVSGMCVSLPHCLCSGLTFACLCAFARVPVMCAITANSAEPRMAADSCDCNEPEKSDSHQLCRRHQSKSV